MYFYHPPANLSCGIKWPHQNSKCVGETITPIWSACGHFMPRYLGLVFCYVCFCVMHPPRNFKLQFPSPRVWPLILCLFCAGRIDAWQMLQPPLATPWTTQVNTNSPLPEYPRPQLVRSNWLNLNAVWQFEPGVTNTDPVPTNQTLSGSILVPFPMESAISGVMAYHAW